MIENFEFEKSDYFEMDEKSRIESLRNHCEHQIPSYKYSKPLSRLEIERKNSELNQALQEIERLKEEMKELGKQKQFQAKIVHDNNEQIVARYVQVTEPVFEVINLGTGYLEMINTEGYIIEKQRIKSGTQLSMHSNLAAENKKEAI